MSDMQDNIVEPLPDLATDQQPAVNKQIVDIPQQQEPNIDIDAYIHNLGELGDKQNELGTFLTSIKQAKSDQERVAHLVAYVTKLHNKLSHLDDLLIVMNNVFAKSS